MEWFVQQHQEVHEKVETRMPCSSLSLYVFFSKEKNQNPLNLSLSNSAWALKMLQSKNVLLSSRGRSVTGRGSEAYKQWNESGVERGASLWVRVRVSVHMYVRLHTRVCPQSLLCNSKPQGCVGDVCLKPKLRTAASLLWPVPREAWSLIYNRFQPRPLDEAGWPSCGSWWEAAGPSCRRNFRNVNGMPECGPSELGWGWEPLCGHLLRPRKSHSNSFSRMVLFKNFN